MQNTRTLLPDGIESMEERLSQRAASDTERSRLINQLANVEVGDLIEVRWLDAWQDDELDADTDSWKDTCEVRTVGVLRRKTPVVSVTQDAIELFGQFRNVYHIPHPYITEVIRYGRPDEA